MRHRYLNSDALFINFDLELDLSPLFNWNTKHVFVYVLAEYTTPDSVRLCSLLASRMPNPRARSVTRWWYGIN